MAPRRKTNEVEINQIWRERDTNCDRFIRIFEVTALDAKVRSCLLGGVLCAKTPFFRMPLRDLQARFDCVAALSVFQIDEAAQDDPTVPRLTTPDDFLNMRKGKK